MRDGIGHPLEQIPADRFAGEVDDAGNAAHQG